MIAGRDDRTASLSDSRENGSSSIAVGTSMDKAADGFWWGLYFLPSLRLFSKNSVRTRLQGPASTPRITSQR